MTALTCYGTVTVSTTLATASTLATVTGGTATTKGTRCGSGAQLNWGELVSQGTTTAWAGAGSIGSPSGKGWLLDATTLEGQTIAAGNWTPTLSLRYFGTATGFITNCDMHVRAYKRSSGGVYTQIGSDMILTGQTLGTSTTVYTFGATSLAQMAFATGDKLYIDAWLDIFANGNTSSNAQINVSVSSTTQGVANDTQIVTPGYNPTPGGTHFFICDGYGGVFS